MNREVNSAAPHFFFIGSLPYIHLTKREVTQGMHPITQKLAGWDKGFWSGGDAGAFPYCGTVILGSLEVLVGLRLE
jgi:hypothetical protein